MPFDARMAWSGTYSENRPERIRIEAAAWQGRPVFFDISGDWVKPGQSSDYLPPLISMLYVVIPVVVCCASIFVAWRNLSAGRGDKKGAYVIALTAFFSSMIVWVLQASHVATSDEIGLVMLAVMVTGFSAGLTWLAYVAVEPYARRHWPDSLISWNRFVAGRFRDPLVASHILAGWLAFFVGVAIVQLFRLIVPSAPSVYGAAVPNLSSTSMFLGSLLRSAPLALSVSVDVLVLVVVMRLLLRIVWLADLIVAIFLVGYGIAVDYSDPLHFAVTAGGYLLFIYCLLFVMRRCGLLSVMAFWLTNFISVGGPLVPLNSWFKGDWICIGCNVAIAAWALWVILSAQNRTARAFSRTEAA
jgi:hypothetical protein